MPQHNFSARGSIVLGHDVRLSNAGMQAALTDGMVACVRDVIDIGLCGTEEVYFQTANLGAAGGIMVTARHNHGLQRVQAGW
jgi:phosphomannomutase/phosphoglucomutase